MVREYLSITECYSHLPKVHPSTGFILLQIIEASSNGGLILKDFLKSSR
jgi:hypothetical protein